jgi:hypothetical protein
MSIASPAIKIQYNNVPFLTRQATVSAADIRGYVASIDGYLWRKTDGVAAGFRARLDAIKNNQDFKFWLRDKDTDGTAYTPHNVLGNNILEQLQQLDHIALDIKDAAHHAYLCTPILANVPKQLTKTNAADRALLDDVISSFSETSCTVNQAIKRRSRQSHTFRHLTQLIGLIARI